MRRRKRKNEFSLIRAVIIAGLILVGFFGRNLLNNEDLEQSPTLPEGNLEIHFLDVGQGDCSLLLCDGHAMLIDAGNNDKGTKVQNYLQYKGIEEIDYIIGTHPDSDHIGGMDVILYKFDCDTVILPDCDKDTKTYRDVVDTMKTKHYKRTVPKPGKTYTLGSAQITILGPMEYYKGANNNSVAILIKHGEKRFLFMADAEEEAESDIVKKWDIKADVYKVGHHGSKTATSKEFFEEVNPEFAVISCGEGNSYGHPHAAVLNRLRKTEVEVFRTDEQGTIVATSDGENITWNMSPSESWKVGGFHKDYCALIN